MRCCEWLFCAIMILTLRAFIVNLLMHYRKATNSSESTPPSAVMDKLRELKNNFRG